jgi:hypothetical protein
VLVFGAHAIKNGLGPVILRLVRGGWVTHLATNGAGIIHDWELAFQGSTSEDVRVNLAQGHFGLWRETGYYLNLAINVGAARGLGYGESVGTLVRDQGLSVPAPDVLAREIQGASRSDPEAAARAADLLSVVVRSGLEPGWIEVVHRHPEVGVQSGALAAGVPFTAHPMFGHDIIYMHPLCHGASLGRAAERDFLTFAQAICGLGEGGVYLSVGSAVMSPMIFEKSLSMARNLAAAQGERVDGHVLYVVDLAPGAWDWVRDGEPPPEDPAYYLRYLKTFSRAGGRMRYVCADNRDFLLGLLRALDGPTGG